MIWFILVSGLVIGLAVAVVTAPFLFYEFIHSEVWGAFLIER